MFKEIIKRQQSVNSILRYPKVSESDQNQLKYYRNLERGAVYTNKGFIFLSLFILFKKGFFDKRSKYLFKEISLCSLFLGYNYLFEYSVNQYTWTQVKPIVRKYALMKEREFYELKKIEKSDSQKSIYD